MIIIQATRVLTEVHLAMFSKITTDHLGNPCVPFTVGLSSVDIDATGALNGVDLDRALKRLRSQAERRVMAPDGWGWHDLV